MANSISCGAPKALSRRDKIPIFTPKISAVRNSKGSRVDFYICYSCPYLIPSTTNLQPCPPNVIKPLLISVPYIPI